MTNERILEQTDGRTLLRHNADLNTLSSIAVGQTIATKGRLTIYRGLRARRHAADAEMWQQLSGGKRIGIRCAIWSK